jgi:hypothetical protein
MHFKKNPANSAASANPLRPLRLVFEFVLPQSFKVFLSLAHFRFRVIEN